MRPCPVCLAYGQPGLVPVAVPRTEEDKTVPLQWRPPAQVIWVPCTCCIGGDASCCDTAGANSP
jgi:hypothetical protein